jgi:hypothetical protein
MIIVRNKELPKEFNEMATSCHPAYKGGKYPMWIRVEYTNGEHNPPHAHLYSPEGKPSPGSLITKFLITDKPPIIKTGVPVMKGKPPVPTKYVDLIIKWAKDTRLGVNNWTALKLDWQGLEDTFK